MLVAEHEYTLIHNNKAFIPNFRDQLQPTWIIFFDAAPLSTICSVKLTRYSNFKNVRTKHQWYDVNALSSNMSMVRPMLKIMYYETRYIALRYLTELQCHLTVKNNSVRHNSVFFTLFYVKLYYVILFVIIYLVIFYCCWLLILIVGKLLWTAAIFLLDYLLFTYLIACGITSLLICELWLLPYCNFSPITKIS